jgi:hypothetical protein
VGHSVGLVLVATRVWFIRFCIPPKNLGVPGSSRGTLEHNRADLTLYPAGEHPKKELTINVPVVYIARDIMILMRENPFRMPLEGVGPESRDFFGP